MKSHLQITAMPSGVVTVSEQPSTMQLAAILAGEAKSELVLSSWEAAHKTLEKNPNNRADLIAMAHAAITLTLAEQVRLRHLKTAIKQLAAGIERV